MLYHILSFNLFIIDNIISFLNYIFFNINIKFFINMKYYDGDTLLIRFLKNHQDINIINKILENGYDVNLTNKYNDTALFYSNDYNICKILLDNNININHKNNNGNTAIFSACEKSIIQLFLKYKVNINIRNNVLMNIADFALMCGLDKILDLLLENKIDIYSRINKFQNYKFVDYVYKNHKQNSKIYYLVFNKKYLIDQKINCDLLFFYNYKHAFPF